MADADEVMQPEEFSTADGEEDFSFDEPEVGQEQKLTKDGGLVKKILTKGEGWESPESGDEVTVHYVGTLEDGSEFDSSRGRGDPFKFTLGQGSVIKGWDEGVATMKKGEKAILICRSDYAYGERGSPPKIGPNATLHFEVELLSWKSSKDISNDGGVIKTSVPDKPGDGWERAKPRDEVLVKYEIRVKGSAEVVASSPANGAEFPLSAAGPLRAFGVALPTMKRGEAANLLVRSDYGFSDAERPASVPADAELEVQLELVSWNSVEDVTGDGAVVKKTLSSDTSEWKKPNQGAKVQARLVGRLQDGTVFEDYDADFVTDEGQVPEGVDLAVLKMKKGETAEVTIAPKYAFGAEGAQRQAGAVPADATVVYTVTLKDFENAKETYSMSDEEKVQEAAARKDKGNDRFKAGKWAAALAKYKSATDLAEQAQNFAKDKDDIKASAREVLKSALLNQAACHLKLGANRDAMTAANKVLEKDGSNVKALYRRAQAYLALSESVEAETDIKRALAEEPGNAGVRTLYKQYKQKSAAADKKDKAVFSRMFKPAKDVPAAAPAGSPADVDSAAAKDEASPMEADAPAANGAEDGSA